MGNARHSRFLESSNADIGWNERSQSTLFVHQRFTLGLERPFDSQDEHVRTSPMLLDRRFVRVGRRFIVFKLFQIQAIIRRSKLCQFWKLGVVIIMRDIDKLDRAIRC